MSYGSSPSRSGAPSPRVPSKQSWQERAMKNIAVEDPFLLRGMPASVALRNFATVLSDKAPTEEYFELSAPVEQIGSFVSHNWETPRWKKFLVLTFHFNLTWAIVISFIVATGAAGLTAQGIFPTVPVGRPFRETEGDIPRGVLSCPLGLLAFATSLLALPEIQRCFPCFNRHTIFLDKTCVAQCDPELKHKGIQSLAAFIQRSKDMIVLYSNVYMHKLWTIYEVASWLLLHRGERLIVRPLWAPTFILYELACNIVLELGLAAIFIAPGELGRAAELVLVFSCIWLACIVHARMGVRWANERDKIFDAVSTFCLADAKCASEDDRVSLQKNIIAFMKFVGMSEALSTDDEVFRTFEALVRKEVPKLVRSSFGRVGVPYSWAATVALPRALVGADYVAGDVISSQSTRETLVWSLPMFVTAFASVPLTFAGVLALTRHRRMRSRLASIGVGLIGAIFIGGTYRLMVFFTLKAVDSDLWLASGVAAYAVLCLATVLVYRPVRGVKAEQQPPQPQGV